MNYNQIMIIYFQNKITEKLSFTRSRYLDNKFITLVVTLKRIRYVGNTTWLFGLRYKILIYTMPCIRAC